MNNYKMIKCPYCGSVDGIKKLNDSYKCSYCDCEFFETKEKEEILLSEAQLKNNSYKFSEADEIYQELALKALEKNDQKLYTMALWGRMLAFFGVIYLKSYESKESIPTFTKYDKRFKDLKDNLYYQKIMKANLSNDLKMKYEKMLENLNHDYKKITEELLKTPEYDVFLCVKISLKTDNNLAIEGYSKDSKEADIFYDELTKRGLKVFYSEKCCQGINYDAQILSALSRSKMLLVISTKKDYLESRWVMSEWRRWLNFIDEGLKEENSLILYLPTYDEGFMLPQVLSKKKIQYFTNSMQVCNHIIKTLETKNDENIKDEKINKLLEEIEKLKKSNKEASKEDIKEKEEDLDLNYELMITKDEALNGTVKSFKTEVSKICPYCEGTKCLKCHNLGYLKELKDFEIKIPKGIKEHTKMRLKGLGNFSKDLKTRGNIYLEIKFKDDYLDLKEENGNYYTKIKVKESDVLKENTINLKLKDKEIGLKIPKYLKDGQKVKLKNFGPVNPKTGVKGDLFLIVEVLKDLN